MSTLDQMRAFVTVVEEGSFTAAALQFDISPTAMSKKIAMLEKSLNTRLLIRTPRLLSMTDIGKKYYAQCKKVLHEYTLSNLLIEEQDSNLSGVLNIVCMREVAQKLVYPTMAIFLEQYPNIITNVMLKKQAEDIILENFDIAIGYEPSEAFNNWCSCKVGRLLLYYPNIKPKPLKIKAYIDYLEQKNQGKKMKINQIIVLKETRENEGRVALTPATVKKLIEKNYVILVESGAGALAGFSDEEYIKAGAEVFEVGKKSFPSHSLFLRVKRPTLEREALENKFISNDSAMIGFLDPFDINQESHLVRWKNLGLKIIDLELLPLAANDPKNPLAAMSQIAGELALEDALDKYQGDQPKKVTVIGTGSAGLAVARAARKLKLPVQLFGRKEQYKKIADELGATYHLLPATNQVEFIRQYLSDQTIIVAAARVVGEKSPLLIDNASLAVLPDNTVVVDLSAGEGSSVVGSHQDAIVKAERGILIVNVSGYPKARPKLASEGFAERMVNLLLELMPAESRIDLNHPILKQI